ncbi:hypothetical protein [Cryobacterium sp. BB736]|uniref:hypothetical protein n=1 Tax=Cryobacterium sp. BB736 TaxID=2746963 RepID=UPI0018736D75|nr:hypothetical protein [Cryobacterium sp. BB736]
MKRDTVSAYRSRTRATEAMIDAAVAEVKAEADAAWQANKEAAKQAEQERVKFTRDDIDGAAYVRDRFGWHEVIRINKVTITVATPYSWTEQIPFAKVLEVRKAVAA